MNPIFVGGLKLITVNYNHHLGIYHRSLKNFLFMLFFWIYDPKKGYIQVEFQPRLNMRYALAIVVGWVE
jgi:hypothetical protein